MNIFNGAALRKSSSSWRGLSPESWLANQPPKLREVIRRHGGKLIDRYGYTDEVVSCTEHRNIASGGTGHIASRNEPRVSTLRKERVR